MEEENEVRQTMCLSNENCESSYLNYLKSKDPEKQSKSTEFGSASKQSFNVKKFVKK